MIMRKSHLVAALVFAATASVASATVFNSGAHAAVPSGSDPDAPNLSSRDNGLDEHTTLETCTANYGGEKVSAVGFCGSIANDGSLNRVKAGHRTELEYRIEDTDNNCVVFDTSVPAASSNEVSCADTAVVLGPAGSFTTPKFERGEKHFKQYWNAPKGKNRCYSVVVSGLQAFFRTR